ncbi:MAG: D-lysine 5,6-aminomutase subunit alpha, partial [Pseudothermotoga sp.]|nr:D-lysine 5,6-aminomutase subunit alpha [Pseudothermotoga sp.]
EHISDVGLFSAIEQGIFADIRRSREAGKGLEGVFKKGEAYENPIRDALEQELGVKG